MNYIKPMLCQELTVNEVIKENGMDEKKVTTAYRNAIVKALAELMGRGFVAERKAI